MVVAARPVSPTKAGTSEKLFPFMQGEDLQANGIVLVSFVILVGVALVLNYL